MNNEVLKMQNDGEQISALVDGQLSVAQAAALLARSRHDTQLRAVWHDYQLIGDVLRAGAAHAQVGFVTGMASKSVTVGSAPLSSGDSLGVAHASVGSASSHSAAFLANFHARLAADDALPAAAAPSVMPQTVSRAAVRSGFDASNIQSIAAPNAEAANASLFRWKLASGFASMAAVAAIGWGAVSSGFLGLGDATQTMARNASSSTASSSMPSSQTNANGSAATTANGAATAQSGQAPAVMQRDPRFEAYLAAHKQFGGASALAQPAGLLRSASFEAGR